MEFIGIPEIRNWSGMNFIAEFSHALFFVVLGKMVFAIPGEFILYDKNRRRISFPKVWR